MAGRKLSIAVRGSDARFRDFVHITTPATVCVICTDVRQASTLDIWLRRWLMSRNDVSLEA
jgi:hypothetical protein